MAVLETINLKLATVSSQLYSYNYCIMQIVCGGKLTLLQCLVEICGKTFAVVLFMQYLLSSFMKLSLKNYCGSYCN